MVFILAGIDGCGKTTLVEHLKTVFPDLIYMKETCPGTNVKARIERLKLLEYYVENDMNVMYDRATVLDDMVYEPVKTLRDSIFKNATLLPRVKSVLSRCCILYLDCPMDVLTERLVQRGDDYVTVDDIVKIERSYREVFKMLESVNCSHLSLSAQHESLNGEACSLIDSILRCRYNRKTPKLAHIVPKSALELTRDNQYHMCLAHLVLQDEEYAKFYRRMSDEGKYVLMDNGAAEGARLSFDDLVTCYHIIQPTEMVLPDILSDGENSFGLTTDALAFFKEQGLKCKFMAVPQGKSFSEWCDSAKHLMSCNVESIGVSKFLTITTKNPRMRYNATKKLQEYFESYGRPDIEVHLLGCDAGCVEVAEICHMFDFVRGCDTALAFICAKTSTCITNKTLRPRGEIDFLNDEVEKEEICCAMNEFNGIVGIVNEEDPTWL